MESLEVIALTALAAVLFLSNGLFRRRRRRAPRDKVRAPRSRRESGRRRPARTISGKAYVTDGDGIRVSGQEIRIAGIDAPEWDQPARHGDGRWFAHGKQVKSALIRKIGGRRVRVEVEEYDRFGRAIGVVTCDGCDIGEWLVREGHAIAAYSERYRHVEREARRARRGMWAHARNIDPRAWRHRRARGV
ncbi:MAG: thermonuclease family protein [Defluviicoccus sp.]|nr:thermonuclease family protein [Defluviicoccus sp.]